MRSLGMVNPVRGEGLGLKTAPDLGALGPEIVDAPGQGMAEKDQDIESQIFTTLFSNLLVIILLVNHDFSSGYHVLVSDLVLCILNILNLKVVVPLKYTGLNKLAVYPVE